MKMKNILADVSVSILNNIFFFHLACDCNSVGSLDNFCDSQTGNCKCRLNTYGRQCDECQPGYWNYPNCRRCDCNGHADTCDSRTGYCIDCKDFTAGPKCDR